MNTKNLAPKVIALGFVGSLSLAAGYVWSKKAVQVARTSGLASRSLAAQDTIFSIRGIEGVNVDSWTMEFFGKREGGGFPGAQEIAQYAISAYSDAAKLKDGKLSDLFERILRAGYPKKAETAAHHRALAEGLLKARVEIQPEANDLAFYDQALTLLETLAEESLYAGATKDRQAFTGADRYFTPSFVENTDADTACGTKWAVLNGVHVCEGDILASKGGAGSSSLLARMSDRPGNFSHSTIARVSESEAQGEGNVLRFAEAFIEDGVKLRKPGSDYENDPAAKLEDAHGKKKLYIFRYRSKDASERAEVIEKAGVQLETFIKKMNKNSGGRPGEVASFEYDFEMNGETQDRYFCSEIPYWIYYDAGITDARNPYDKPRWSTVSGSTQKFLRDFLDIRPASYPAPSDVNFNPRYELVAVSYDATRLWEDRIDVALIDSMIQFVSTDEGKVVLKEFLAVASKIPSGPITPAQKESVRTYLKTLREKAVLPFELTDEQLEKYLSAIPKNITVRQLAFFAYLDKFLAPKVRKEISEELARRESESKYKQVGAIELRKMVFSRIGSKLEEFAKKQATALQQFAIGTQGEGKGAAGSSK